MTDSAGTSVPETSVSDALARADAGEALFLDVRERSEWDLGHSPLATLMPMSELSSRIDEVPVDRPILVICRSGQRSARVAAALVGAGYDAINVVGGMLAVQSVGGELVSDGPAPARVE